MTGKMLMMDRSRASETRIPYDFAKESHLIRHVIVYNYQLDLDHSTQVVCSEHVDDNDDDDSRPHFPQRVRPIHI